MIIRLTKLRLKAVRIRASSFRFIHSQPRTGEEVAVGDRPQCFVVPVGEANALESSCLFLKLKFFQVGKVFPWLQPLRVQTLASSTTTSSGDTPQRPVKS